MLRLPAFQLFLPHTLPDALSMLAEDAEHTSVLAGGTDLLPNMKRRQVTPKRLVSLKHVPGLRSIDVLDHEIRIGSAVNLCEIEEHPLLRQEAKALCQAVGQIATVPIRSTATIGGNVCLDTRCEYINQSELWRKAIGFCKKKDGDICWVATSSPRCLAVSSTDAAPALSALSAQVVLSSVRGERVLDLLDLYENDGEKPLTKQKDELVTQIRLPRRVGQASCYWKLRRRGAFDFPLLGVAVAIGCDDEKRVKHARLVLGAVASRPLLVPLPLELFAKGLDAELIAKVQEAAHALAKPMDHADLTLSYRKAMTKTLVALALREVFGEDMTDDRKRLERQLA